MAASLISVVDNIAPMTVRESNLPCSNASSRSHGSLSNNPNRWLRYSCPPKRVYDKVCAACHATGTLGAPKVGAKDLWNLAFAQGLDTLVTHAAVVSAPCPPGWRPSLTEANLKDAIVYMLEETGIRPEPPAAAPRARRCSRAAARPATEAAPAAEASSTSPLRHPPPK